MADLNSDASPMISRETLDLLVARIVAAEGDLYSIIQIARIAINEPDNAAPVLDGAIALAAHAGRMLESCFDLLGKKDRASDFSDFALAPALEVCTRVHGQPEVAHV